MNAPLIPAERLTLAQARESPCLHCASSPCCTHLPLHRFHIRTLVDLDHALYLLNFDRIELGLAPNGEWSVFYSFPCRFLDTSPATGYLCTLHGTALQPKICVHYNPYSCWYRRALGADPSPELLRIDHRRMAWIAERVVFDSQRVLIEVPRWEQIAAMCADTPLVAEPVDQRAPDPDPVFARWLEASATGIRDTRDPPLKRYEDFLDPCSGCDAQCCKTLIFPHGRPTTRRNLDYLQFALGFPGVEVGVTDEEWKLVVKTRCRHLTADNRCGVYGQPERPMLCKYFDASGCSYVTQFGTPQPEGFLRVQLEQFPWLTEAIGFSDDGAIAQLPATEALRAYIEHQWREAVLAELTQPEPAAEDSAGTTTPPPQAAALPARSEPSSWEPRATAFGRREPSPVTAAAGPSIPPAGTGTVAAPLDHLPPVTKATPSSPWAGAETQQPKGPDRLTLEDLAREEARRLRMGTNADSEPVKPQDVKVDP